MAGGMVGVGGTVGRMVGGTVRGMAGGTVGGMVSLATHQTPIYMIIPTRAWVL